MSDTWMRILGSAPVMYSPMFIPDNFWAVTVSHTIYFTLPTHTLYGFYVLQLFNCFLNYFYLFTFVICAVFME